MSVVARWAAVARSVSAIAGLRLATVPALVFPAYIPGLEFVVADRAALESRKGPQNGPQLLRARKDMAGSSCSRS